MPKVTVIIPTYNEEHNIREALESVKWADELMIVDAFSTDRTIDICREYTGFILQHSYEHSSAQKNWAIPQASNEWIFLVDADERATPELEQEVREVITTAEYSAYWVSRTNFLMGKRIRFGGWQGDKVIRLFHRDYCRYEDKRVHAEIRTAGLVGKLVNPICHHTYVSASQFHAKIDRYTTLAAYDRLDKKEKATFLHLLFKPLFRFVKYYFIKLGFLDGKEGLIIATFASYSVFLRVVKLRDLKAGKKI